VRARLYYQDWIRDLKTVKDILEANEVHFWLDGGALLGAVRNGKLIKHDDDIDLGILIGDDQLNKIISSLESFSKEGFHIRIGYFCVDFMKRRGKDVIKIGNFLRVGSTRVTPIHADLWRICGDKAWHAWLQVGGYSYVPRRLVKKSL